MADVADVGAGADAGQLHVLQAHRGAHGRRPRPAPCDPGTPPHLYQIYPPYLAAECRLAGFGIERYEAESLRLYQVLEDRLEGREYLCGEGGGSYTMADIACFSYANSHWWAGVSEQVAAMPNVTAWLERVGARPAVQQGLCVPSGEQGWQTAPTPEAAAMREAVEGNAAAAGREYFGWRDIGEVQGKPNQRPTGALSPPKPKL